MTPKKFDGVITAMGIPAMVKRYYPGYTGHCVNKEYLNKLCND